MSQTWNENMREGRKILNWKFNRKYIESFNRNFYSSIFCNIWVLGNNKSDRSCIYLCIHWIVFIGNAHKYICNIYSSCRNPSYLRLQFFRGKSSSCWRGRGIRNNLPHLVNLELLKTSLGKMWGLFGATSPLQLSVCTFLGRVAVNVDLPPIVGTQCGRSSFPVTGFIASKFYHLFTSTSSPPS